MRNLRIGYEGRAVVFVFRILVSSIELVVLCERKVVKEHLLAVHFVCTIALVARWPRALEDVIFPKKIAAPKDGPKLIFANRADSICKIKSCTANKDMTGIFELQKSYRNHQRAISSTSPIPDPREWYFISKNFDAREG